MGYEVITWNVIPEDWLPHPPELMAQVMTDHITRGSIVCLHDSIYKSAQVNPLYDRRAMIEALELTLEKLTQFKFVTVPQLLGCGVPYRVNWYQEPSQEMLYRL
jgi:hypothetical protein